MIAVMAATEAGDAAAAKPINQRINGPTSHQVRWGLGPTNSNTIIGAVPLVRASEIVPKRPSDQIWSARQASQIGPTYPYGEVASDTFSSNLLPDVRKRNGVVPGVRHYGAGVAAIDPRRNPAVCRHVV